MSKLFPTYSSPQEKEQAKQQALRQALSGRSSRPTQSALPEAQAMQPASREASTAQPEQITTPEVPSPEAILDRKLLSQLREEFSKAPELDVGKLVESRRKLDEQLAPAALAQLPQIQQYDSALSQLTSKIGDIQKQKKVQLDRAEWANVAENLMNAVVQYASGLYGAKHGVDVSGVRFNKTDWQSRLRNQLDILNDEIDMLREGSRDVEKQKSGEVGRLRESAQEEFKLQAGAEKERTAAAREANAKAVAAAISIFREQKADAEKSIKLSQEASRQGGKEGLRMVDQEYKNVGGKLQGINQAVNLLQGMESGEVADNSANQAKVQAALAKSGVSSEELTKQMEPTGFFSFLQSQDKKAGINYLNKLKEQASQAYQKLDADHEKLYEQATGQKRPESIKFRFEEASGPQVGDVVDGFEFQGGDPSDQNSWKEVK